MLIVDAVELASVYAVLSSVRACLALGVNGGAYNGLEGDDFESEEGKAYKGYNAGEYKVSFALING